MSDLISREAAIEAIDELVSTRSVCVSMEECMGMNGMKRRAIAAIKELPTAEVTLCHLDSPCEYQNADIALPSAQQWIPCSKRLPEEGKQVLVCDDAGFIYTAEGETRIFDGEWQWYESVEYRPMDDVVAWMPLPNPWEGEENDSDKD